MEYDTTEYQKLQVKQYPARTLRETAEGKYWKQFKRPVVAQQIGAVSHIDFNEQYPYNFAITASTRVVVYNSQTRQVQRTFGRFKDVAYSGTFRQDGKLLVAGGQNSIVQVFDAGSRAVLRQLKGHARPVHVARFSPDKIHVLSGGDDVTVRWWDISSGKQVARLDGHQDYVRAAAVSPASETTWVTGGYDHVVRLWDVRSAQCVLSCNHGAPVEDVAFFPSGSLAVTAGGNQLCIWDMLSGGRLLKRLPNFQKTVTCVRLSPMAGPESSPAPRLLAGSLDGHVKIFELDTFRVTHASKYPAPVLSLGLSKDCSTLAVGTADGMLSVRKHARPRVVEPALALKRQRRQPVLTAANYKYFLRGRSARPSVGDYVVAARRKANLAPYDKLLRRFRYRDALNAALATGRPGVVDAVFEELAARGALAAAVGGRDAATLIPLLKHLAKYITDPRHTAVLSGVVHRVLDTYATVVHADKQVDVRLQQLRDAVMGEVRLQEQLMALQGVLEPILSGALMAGLKIT